MNNGLTLNPEQPWASDPSPSSLAAGRRRLAVRRLEVPVHHPRGRRWYPLNGWCASRNLSRPGVPASTNQVDDVALHLARRTGLLT